MEEEQDLELQEDNSETYEETDSTGESEAEETSESSEQRSVETPEQRNARIKRQLERAAKAARKEGLPVEEYLGIKSEKGSKESTQEVDEKYLRLDLKTEGIKSKKEQDAVLNYIREKKLLGHTVDVETALKSLVVKEELTSIRNASATPRPSARPGQVGGERTAEQYAQLVSKGKIRMAEVPLEKQREIRKKRMLQW
jgi:hypothetical protein